MYLSDTALRELLPQLNVRTEGGIEPFKPDEQVQPASVDFRLSAVFWKPLRRHTIDLRRSRLLEIQPRRYYRNVVLTPGETIILGPRQMLLGRTAEEFSVPNGYTAELIGRSSFARMGLMVTAAGGHINPGWRGRMPLQLINFSPNPIRLVAGLPVCQVRFSTLSGPAEHPYGDPVLGSIYIDDDGGPSYWWRDKRIRQLQARFAESAVEIRIQKQLEAFVGSREPEVIERLDGHLARAHLADVGNTEALLEDFANREDRRRTLRRWAINVSRGSFTIGVTGSLYVANKLPPLHWWHWVTWGIAACLIGLSIYAFRTEVGDHFGQSELRASRNRHGA